MVEQSGVDVSEATITELLGNPAFASMDVDDVVSTKLTAPRLTMDAAKANPDLHKHFSALALNGVDKKIKEFATTFGLSKEELDELESEKSSYERVGLLAKKVQAIEAKKASAPSKDKETLLNGFENERLGWKLDAVYSEFIPQMNKDIKANVNLSIAKQYVTDAMQSKGYKIVNKEGNLALVTVEGNEVYENNIKLSLKDFATKVLANESDPTKTCTTKTRYTSSRREKCK
jgi:hypothetical protein